MSCPVIIPVQAFLGVEFLAIVLVWLYVGRCCKQATERVVVVGFLHCTATVYYYAIVALMVFQEVVISMVGQIYITLIVQQTFGCSIFIDHVAAVVRCGGYTAYYMHRAEFLSVVGVGVGNGTSVTERNYLGQR